MNSTPRRPPPGPPSPDQPSTEHIEDKYFYGLNTTTTTNTSSPTANQAMHEPPTTIQQQGPEALATWYKDEAKRLHQHANLSQQRNQMLVQKVLEMRRQLSRSESKISTTTTSSTSSASSTSTSNPSINTTTSSPSTTKTRLTVRELGDSPMMHSSPSPSVNPLFGGGNDEIDYAETKTPTGWKLAKDPVSDKTYYFNRELNLTSWTVPTALAKGTESNVEQGHMGDLAWTELKLQRSHHNFHALSKRTREVETSNAKAAQMIVELRHELENQSIRSEEAKRHEIEGKHLVGQMSSHIDGLKRQVDVQEKKLNILNGAKSEATESADKWRRERREIGGYALRLEKENETAKVQVQQLERKNRELHGELEETRGTLREMHGKLRAQAESARMRLQVEDDPLRRTVESSVLALRTQLEQTTRTVTNESQQNELKDVRERLDETTSQLQDAHTRNEVLTVRANHAQRSVEEYREKSRKLQEFLSQGVSLKEGEMVSALSKVATLESKLKSSQKDTERCREELKSVLSAMDLARDHVSHSAESKDAVERRCEQLRQQNKDAESKTRTLQTRLEVLNEDCLATKKEMGALEADNVHLEQQLITTQRNLASIRQHDSTTSMTMKAFEEDLELSHRVIQETQSKSDEYVDKIHTAENELRRVKIDNEESIRSVERLRSQIDTLNKEHEETIKEHSNRQSEALSKQKDENLRLREEVARTTSEAMAMAATRGDDESSPVMQRYKTEIAKLKGDVAGKTAEKNEIVSRLEEKLQQVQVLEQVNKEMHTKIADMEETMEIKDTIFQEHALTAEKLEKERDTLSAEILSLKTALSAERNGTLLPTSKSREENKESLPELPSLPSLPSPAVAQMQLKAKESVSELPPPPSPSVAKMQIKEAAAAAAAAESPLSGRTSGGLREHQATLDYGLPPEANITSLPPSTIPPPRNEISLPSGSPPTMSAAPVISLPLGPPPTFKKGANTVIAANRFGPPPTMSAPVITLPSTLPSGPPPTMSAPAISLPSTLPSGPPPTFKKGANTVIAANRFGESGMEDMRRYCGSPPTMSAPVISLPSTLPSGPPPTMSAPVITLPSGSSLPSGAPSSTSVSLPTGPSPDNNDSNTTLFARPPPSVGSEDLF